MGVKLYHVNKAGHITGVENPSQGLGLDIKPYGLIGISRNTARQDVSQIDPNAGADMFYRVTANLVSSTTFNTDFAETEVDTRQVNLTRFKLFYPEKRSFFLEDAGIFKSAKIPPYGPPDLYRGGDLLSFFSRRIGLFEDNEIPIRVIIGISIWSARAKCGGSGRKSAKSKRNSGLGGIGGEHVRLQPFRTPVKSLRVLNCALAG